MYRFAVNIASKAKYVAANSSVQQHSHRVSGSSIQQFNSRLSWSRNYDVKNTWMQKCVENVANAFKVQKGPEGRSVKIEPKRGGSTKDNGAARAINVKKEPELTVKKLGLPSVKKDGVMTKVKKKVQALFLEWIVLPALCLALLSLIAATPIGQLGLLLVAILYFALKVLK